MRSLNIKELIPVDGQSNTPKYVQVSDGVIKAIEQRKLVKGDQLPSLRQLSEELNISFDTAKKAYDVLKKKNIVVSAQGKSNVVNATGPIPAYRIFLLFNKLSSPKRLLYEAFAGAFTSRAEIDLHVYNNNLQLFRHLIKTKAFGYTHYVLIPHLTDDPLQVAAIIDKYLDGQSIVLLDKSIAGLRSAHASVHEDFGRDIYSALETALDALKKYSVLHLIYPEESYQPPEIREGLGAFCHDNHFGAATHSGISDSVSVQRGDVYILLSDDDLPTLIQRVRASGMKIGEDVGIISYNETPLKEVLLDGITTISTDFKKMGELAADQIQRHGNEKISVPIHLTLRHSL